MNGSRAAIRYAKAILSFSLEQQKEVEVNNDMILVAKTVNESKELQLLLNSPVLKAELKKTALKEVFAGKVTPLTIGLINLLVDRKSVV